MKTLITIFIILLASNTTFAQFKIIDFDSPNLQDNCIIIDTVSNPNNIWQIGIPQKTVFDSAYSLTHAIVTDTLNPYPVDDTSSFFLIFPRWGCSDYSCGNVTLQLNFWFKFNSDSLSDYGMVEASIDNGLNWINLLTEDTTYSLIWLEQKPILTGNSNGWQHFSLNLRSLTYELGYSDTLLYKFTFISDSIETNKEGWMIDYFQLADEWEGIDELGNCNLVKIYPNPVENVSVIEWNNTKNESYSIEFYNMLGEKQKVVKNIKSNKFKIHKNDFLPGVYLFQLINKKNEIKQGRFVVK